MRDIALGLSPGDDRRAFEAQADELEREAAQLEAAATAAEAKGPKGGVPSD